MENKNYSLIPVIFSVFISLLGFGIVVPVLALLFLDPINGIFSLAVPESTRLLLLGLLLAAYPAAQFFGAPIFGEFSDHYGRKKILMIALSVTCLGYLIFGIGVVTKNIWLLFAGRIIDGFTGGDVSIAMSAIADVSSPRSKARNFGFIGMAFGLGFILGPAIGGILSSGDFSRYFNLATPFWFAAALSFINVFFILFMFKESLKHKRKGKIKWNGSFVNIYRAFQIEKLRTMFVVIFFLTIGFTFFTQFFQVYLIERFVFNETQIGYMFAYAGLWVAISQGIILTKLTKRFHLKSILVVALFLLPFALLSLLMPERAKILYLLLPFAGMFYGLSQPVAVAIISNSAKKDSQGEILGINQSVQSLAFIIPPIVAGAVSSVHVTLPIIIGSISALFAWIVFIAFYKPGKKGMFEEI